MLRGPDVITKSNIERYTLEGLLLGRRSSHNQGLMISEKIDSSLRDILLAVGISWNANTRYCMFLASFSPFSPTFATGLS